MVENIYYPFNVTCILHYGSASKSATLASKLVTFDDNSLIAPAIIGISFVMSNC